MINKLLSVLLLVFLSSGWNNVQSQTYVLVTSQMNGTLVECQNQVNYSVTIQNISPYSLFNVSLVLDLPQGVSYVVGSASSGAIETNVSNLDSVGLSLQNIPSLTSYTFSVSLTSECVSLNNGLSNLVSLAFEGNNGSGGFITASKNHTSQLYNILQPDLALIAMSNQNLSASIGDIFQRCITITNGGTGSLGTFELMHSHGSGIMINSATQGNMTTVLGGTLYTFVDFTTIGNNDAFFDPGEILVICETIEIIACSNAQSYYEYRWGCNGNYCQQMYDAGNINFANEVPNLQITRQTSYNNSANGLGANCYGNNVNGDFPSSVTINNTGTGNAINSLIRIGLSATDQVPLITNTYSSFNLGSFTIEINGGGQFPIVPDTIVNIAARSCLPASPVGGVSFIIPVIAPGDEIIIRWNQFTCAPDFCENNVMREMLHWRLEGLYSNECGQQFPIVRTQALPGCYGALRIRNVQLLDNSPGTLIGASGGAVTFMAGDYYNTIPVNSSNLGFRYQVILPSNCLNVDLGSFTLRNELGQIQAAPSFIDTHGDTIDFHYTTAMTGTQWTATFDVSLDCNTCSISGPQTILFNTLLSPDLTCGEWITMGCSSATIELFCPPVCEGINLMNTTVKRINYGLSDNDNNGIPDPLGTVMDMSLVRQDRVMYGDTIEVKSSSFVQNSTNLNLNHIVSKVTIEDMGNFMTYHSSSLRIVDASSGAAYNYTNLVFTPTIVGTTNRTWTIDIDLNTLVPSLPIGFVLSQGDSVIISSFYSNSVNIGGTQITAVPVVSELFATEIPFVATLPANQRFGCNVFTKEFTLIGYYWTNYGSDVQSTQSCDELTISQNYYLSIGQCCGNYAGGNLFSFEYRHWGSPSILEVNLPDDYEFIDADFNFVRTTGTLLAAGTPYFPLVPSLAVLNTYQFDVSGYFGDVASGAPILFGDDGFYGTLRVKIRPTCNVENSTHLVNYKWYFDQVNQLSTSGTPPSVFVNNDLITYNGPVMSIQSNQLFVNSEDGIESWDLTINNGSNISDAENFWIGTSMLSGILGDSIQELSTGNTYYPSANGIFNLATISPNQTKVFRLFTTSTSCVLDSITVYSGWGCSGVPVTIASYECAPLSLVLKVEPLFPAIDNHFDFSLIPELELCDTLVVDFTVRNYQLGNGFNLISNVVIPTGMDLVNGSSELIYNGITYPIPNPTIVSASEYSWNLSATILNASGLIGIINPLLNSYVIRYKVITHCGFESGSRMYGFSRANSYCGSTHISDNQFSDPIFISDVVPPYSASIDLGIDFVTPCGIDNNMIISLSNNGPGQFDSSDSLFVFIPTGLSYDALSFMPIHNAGLPITEPVVSTIPGFQVLSWGLLSGVVASDSMVFQISLNAAPIVLPCDIIEFRASMNSQQVATCIENGSICDVTVVTADTMKNVFVYKTDFIISNALATISLDATGDEYLSGSLDLFNQGATLGITTPLVISIYNDLDLNGIYSTGDVLIQSDAVNSLIASGGVYNYAFDSVLVQNVCQLVIIVSTVDNPCICETKQVLVVPNNFASNLYIELCSNDSIAIGNPVTANYVYQWDVSPDLNSLTAEQPLFSTIVVGSLPVTYQLPRKITKSSCVVWDTTFVTVNPLPQAVIIGDNAVCLNATSPIVTFIGSNGVAPYTFTYHINNETSQIITSLGDSVSISFPTDSAGTFIYYLENVQDSSNTLCSQVQLDTVTIIVNPLPEANIIGDITVCQNSTSPVVTFTGSVGTAPYTFTYHVNNDASTTITSLLDTISISVATDSVGTFIYYLESVDESSSLLCAQNQFDTVTVVVRQLPEATISGDVFVCMNSTSPEVLFTGSNGTAPYTFTYNVNGGTSQTITSILDSVSVPVPTDSVGSFIYYLESVDESSSLFCSQVQLDTVTVIVNPLPEANITGNTIVCRSSASPLVTFTGLSGTAPYTFTYHINNQSSETVTSSGNSVAVSAPTDSAGTFIYYLESVVDSSSSICSQVQLDTVTIIVNPLPEATVIGDMIVCKDFNSPIVTFIGSNGTAPYVFTYHLNNGPSQTITSLVDSVSISVPTDNVGTFIYYLESVVDASSTICTQAQLDTVTVIVNPLPLAIVSGGATFCLNSIEDVYVTFTGSNGTAPYTFNYSINNGPVQTVSSIGNSATVLVPTNSVGIFNYELIEVTDASPSACSQLVSGITVVTIKALPTAQIIGGDSLCLNMGNPPIEFFGADGTNPFTFTYTINNGASQNITTTVGQNNVILLTPSSQSGTFVYNLVSVSESGHSCAQNQTGSVSIVVHPEPIAAFTPTPNILMFSDNVSQMINNSSGATDYIWNFGDGSSSNSVSPYHQFEIDDEENFIITLTAISQYGCISTITEIIKVIEDELIYVPNTFTPDGDQYNNLFTPVITSGIDIYSYNMEIYDRWGEKIFTTNDVSLGWDGTYNGRPVQDGVFVWIINYQTKEITKWRTLKGHVNVLR